MENANKILFRASGLGHLMTESREKSPMQKWLDSKATLEQYEKDYSDTKNKETKTAAKKLESIEKLKLIIPELEAKKDDVFISDGAKTHCINTYASQHYGRREQAQSKYLEKGIENEEDAISLLSRVTKTFYKKNTQRLENQFITGECDIFTGEDILHADSTLDTKCSWSLFTFLRAKHGELDPIYFWQGVSYMMLTGATKHTIAYCLVNGTPKHILDEKRKVAYSLGIVDTETDEYIQKCIQIERNHIFDLSLFRKHNPFFEFHNDISKWEYDIPMNERVALFSFDRNEEDIELIKKKVEQARIWMDKNLFCI